MSKRNKKYSSKSTKSTKPTRTKSERTLYREAVARARAQLYQLASEANKVVSQLEPDDLLVVEAKRTRPKSRRSDDLFATKLVTMQQMNREIARAEKLLSDWRSTPEGRAYYQSEEFGSLYRGLFGGKYAEEYGVNYDASIINKEYAKKAFELYRKLVTEEAGSEDYAKMLWSKKGKSEYGSENMITAIYDMVVQGYGEENILNYGREKLELNYLKWQQSFSKFNSVDDYGVINNDTMKRNRAMKGVIENAESDDEW